MKPRFILVHGWAGSPKYCWFPWLKNELELLGAAVIAPALPNPLWPKIEEWVPFLSKVVGEANEDTFFIGHSIGCQTILRFLETLPETSKVGGAILVAPFFELKGIEREIARPWLETPINCEKISKILPASTAIFSDNDPLVPLENKDLFAERLRSKIIVVPQAGHFEFTKKLPLILEEIAQYEPRRC